MRGSLFLCGYSVHANMSGNNRLIKLKEPGSHAGSFNFSVFIGGEEKLPYEANFITCLQNMLDATPTSTKRLHNVIYELFLSKICVFLRPDLSVLRNSTFLSDPENHNFDHVLCTSVIPDLDVSGVKSAMPDSFMC